MNQTMLAIAGLGTPELIVIVLGDLFAFRRHPVTAVGERPWAKAKRRFEKVSKKANATSTRAWKSSLVGPAQS
jgi:hypothetical protein